MQIVVMGVSLYAGGRGIPIWRARRVLTYIESNISKEILVAALARIAGVSGSHFSRTFRARFGISPHAYITQRRVKVAQMLMLRTNDSLSQISLACGMSDQAHLARVFRKFTGETPRQWRTARRHPKGAAADRDKCAAAELSDATR